MTWNAGCASSLRAYADLVDGAGRPDLPRARRGARRPARSAAGGGRSWRRPPRRRSSAGRSGSSTGTATPSPVRRRVGRVRAPGRRRPARRATRGGGRRAHAAASADARRMLASASPEVGVAVPRRPVHALRRPSVPTSAASGSPPTRRWWRAPATRRPGWGNPYQPGTVTLLTADEAVFADDAGHEVRLRADDGGPPGALRVRAHGSRAALRSMRPCDRRRGRR